MEPHHPCRISVNTALGRRLHLHQLDGELTDGTETTYVKVIVQGCDGRLKLRDRLLLLLDQRLQYRHIGGKGMIFRFHAGMVRVVGATLPPVFRGDYRQNHRPHNEGYWVTEMKIWVFSSPEPTILHWIRLMIFSPS